MPDVPDEGRGTSKIWFVVAIVAIAAFGVRVYQVQSQKDDEDASPWRNKTPIDVVISQIEHGDDDARAYAFSDLIRNVTEPSEFDAIFPHLIQGLRDPSDDVRIAAASVVGNLVSRFARKSAAGWGEEASDSTLCVSALDSLTAMLDALPSTERATVLRSIGNVAAVGRPDIPPARLIACLDDELENVRVEAVKALLWYRKGPEAVVPVALRRLPGEGQQARKAYSDVFWFTRLEPSALPALVDGLRSENTEVCLVSTVGINHMGREARPALPDILALIRRELEAPHHFDQSKGSDILGMASGAIGELTSDDDHPPDAVDLLCKVLESADEAETNPGPDRPELPGRSTRALKMFLETRRAEAVWSLGILGRTSLPAVPRLVSLFESTPEHSAHLRVLLAEALAAICRGTPEEGRVLDILAKAWKTAPQKQMIVLARALRTLSPKADQVVPGLKDMPPDEEGSEIRRVRYPRDRSGYPVRE